MLKKIWLNYKPEVIFIPLILALDRASKVLALKLLAPTGDVEVFSFFHLTYVQNTGAAFGSFGGANTALAAAAFIVLALLIKWRADIIKTGALARFGVLFIIAGAIGNLYDRIALGFVVDYFNFLIWPVFNVADSFITVGAGLLIISFIKEQKGGK